jgi:CRP-like cAMP-binding protein
MNAVQPLSQEDISYISGFIRIAEIPAGATWSAESKQCFGWLEQGLLLKVARIMYKMRILGIHKDGDSFPLGTVEVNFRYKAAEPSVIYYINHEDIQAIYTRFPRVVGILFKLMQRDMRELDYYLNLNDEPDPLTRYQLYVKRYPAYAARVPVKVLAKFLMMSVKMIEVAREKQGKKLI